MSAAPQASAGPSVWELARAEHPKGTKLLRVIDLKAMTQRFDVLPPAENFSDYDLDGCTLIMPQLARTEEERGLILDLYDRLWLEARALARAE